ncbi:MAG: protein kinase [bacterium]|nr:protein kinase [bacterium]
MNHNTSSPGVCCPQCGVELQSGRGCLNCGETQSWRTTKGPWATVPLDGDALANAKDHSCFTSSDHSFLKRDTPLLGRYRIIDVLGRGGMGRVFKAEDLVLRKKVALKFLHKERVDDDSIVERFREEVRTAQQVSHRNVCRLHDIHEIGGLPFISMEYVDGESLFELLQRNGRPPKKRALEIALQICSGLEALHMEGILHRDLKPANIMIDRKGRALITDFGLAAMLADTVSEADGSAAGTMAYMAPEQLKGSELSLKSDLFSLGIILYEIFTGQPPFSVDSHIHGKFAVQLNVTNLISQHKRGPELPLSVCDDLDHVISDVIMRCLELEPAKRPDSAREVYETLRGVSHGEAYKAGTDYERLRADPSPFITGRVVWGEAFLGRESETSTLLNRTLKGESTAVVGGLKSGKSSLLRQLANDLLKTSKRVTVHRIDLRSVSDDFTPASFWKESLEALHDHSDDLKIGRLLEAAEPVGYERRSLLRLFEQLGEKDWRLVLLLDEFEQIFTHINFKYDNQFFALLRSIATTSGGLTLVPASRLSVTQLNEEFPPGDRGSPYFNFLIDVHLRPFDEDTVEELLGRAGEKFSPDDRHLIRRLAGRQPFLLQAMADALFETRGGGRHERAGKIFYGQIRFYFQELWDWEGFTNNCRTTGIILALAEWAGRAANKDIDYREIGHRDDIDFELHQLEKLGLAEQATESNEIWHKTWLIWRGQKWGVTAHSFAWWIWELVVTETSKFSAYAEWLTKEGYSCVLTRKEWRKLLARVREQTDWRLQGVDRMAHNFLTDFYARSSK